MFRITFFVDTRVVRQTLLRKSDFNQVCGLSYRPTSVKRHIHVRFEVRSYLEAFIELNLFTCSSTSRMVLHQAHIHGCDHAHFFPLKLFDIYSVLEFAF